MCAATDGQALPPDVAPDQSFQPQVPAGLGIELVSFREYNVCCLSESISTIWARHWDHQQQPKFLGAFYKLLFAWAAAAVTALKFIQTSGYTTAY